MEQSWPLIQIKLREKKKMLICFREKRGSKECACVRERNERNSSFSLRSTEIRWSESVELRFKVYLLDEGYA